MFIAAVCTAPPTQNRSEPVAIVHRRPKRSLIKPAIAAPQKAPAVNRETTRPVAVADGLLNTALKDPDATTSATTPY